MAIGHPDDQDVGSSALAYKVVSAASTNAAVIKASPGVVCGWIFGNIGAAFSYLKLYNKTTSPTVGTDVPRLTIPLPPGAAGHVTFVYPIGFETGIGMAIVSGIADSSTGAVNAAEVVIDVLYL